MPNFIVREFVDNMLPFIASMVKVSLTKDYLPDSKKHVVMSPLLKKPGLDTASPSAKMSSQILALLMTCRFYLAS